MPVCSIRANATSILHDADWSRTRAYGLGINGLYLNLKGRERDGIVEPGEEQERLTRQLIARLQAVQDDDGQRVIRRVYRTDEVYAGNATELAPDLILGYAPGYRASWATCLGELTTDVLMDNDSAWSADHCADALEVPGVLCCNRTIRAAQPALIDLAPSILAEFGLPTPELMSGKKCLFFLVPLPVEVVCAGPHVSRRLDPIPQVFDGLWRPRNMGKAR